MPNGKRQQNDVTLYTLIAFIGLFVAALTFAIIFYLQTEKQRTIAVTSKEKLNEMASDAELRNIGEIVGAKQGKKTRLATMVDYLDRTVSLIIGGVPEDTSAEAKINTVDRKFNETLELLASSGINLEIGDPNTAGLIYIVEKLKAQSDNLAKANIALAERLNDLQLRFDNAMQATFQKEQTLLAEKEKYQQQVNEIKTNYEELKKLMEQTTEKQVQTLRDQRDQERNNKEQLYKDLLKTEAELKTTQSHLKIIQEKLDAIVPPPDSEAIAFKPDGQIILIDNKNKLVHLNIGGDDGVYKGLTFSVYGKNAPIPRDGKGKAEIEVFNVEKTISVARIIKSTTRNPIVSGDIVANLIWDGSTTNVFAVVGDFDLDDDGVIDYNGAEKIKALVEKWGGRVVEDITVDTNFLVLGMPPKILTKPTFEEIQLDPLAMEKYETSIQNLAHYKEVLQQAQRLSIPILNMERFLDFIGYKSQAPRPEAF